MRRASGAAKASASRPVCRFESTRASGARTDLTWVLFSAAAKIAEFREIAIITDEMAYLAQVAGELLMFRAGKSELHIVTRASKSIAGYAWPSAIGCWKRELKEPQAEQQQGADTVLKRKVLEFA